MTTFIISSEYMQSLVLETLSPRHYYIYEIKENETFVLPTLEIKNIVHYLFLLKNVLKKESEVLIPSERELIKHIILSFVVNMLILYKKHHTESDFGDRDLSKDKYMMMDKFVELLEVYHTRERELQFYAEKMCITPKYLSTLVHSITGRKATDWISDFVIIEAKSMLAYSGNNIQEIFYRLNFPTRSAFGKYFKTYVGMTPHRISRKESTLRKNKHIREINQCFPK